MPSSSSTVSVIVRGLCVLAIAGIGAMVYYAITIQKWSSAEMSLDVDPAAVGGTANKAGDKIRMTLNLDFGLKDTCIKLTLSEGSESHSKEECKKHEDFTDRMQCALVSPKMAGDTADMSGTNSSFALMIVCCILFSIGFVSQPIIMCYDRARRSILLRLLPRLAIAASIAACSGAVAYYHSTVRTLCGSEDLCTMVDKVGDELVLFINSDSSASGSGSGSTPSPPSITCTLNSQCFIMATAACVLATIVLVLNFIFVGKPEQSPTEAYEAEGYEAVDVPENSSLNA